MRNLNAFTDTLKREFDTTRRVVANYPSAQGDFRPHERSNTARQLIWTFVVEERMMLFGARDGEVMGKAFIPAPDDWGEMLSVMEKTHEELLQFLTSTTEDKLAPHVSFFVAPKQMGQIPTMQFLWFMLHDHIHHRGQLSVYLRMAGGKVPSIYGPSADEPWN